MPIIGPPLIIPPLPEWPPPLTTLPVPTDGDTVVYSIVLEDGRNEGLLALPVYTSDPTTPTPCKIVRLHAAIEGFVVRWEAVRQGGFPQIPSHKSLDPNLVFLRGARGRPAPVPDPTSEEKIWSVAGWYEYARITPEGLDSDMVESKHPWDVPDVNTNTIAATSVYRQDLIGVKADPALALLNPITTGS